MRVFSVWRPFVWSNFIDRGVDVADNAQVIFIGELSFGAAWLGLLIDWYFLLFMDDGEDVEEAELLALKVLSIDFTPLRVIQVPESRSNISRHS